MTTTVPTLPNDPPRPPAAPFPIRGTLLRHALKFTLIAWIPGAFWQGATGNTAITPLAQFLGANDLLLSLIIVAAPALSALLQIPGALVVEHLGARKKFFITTVTPHRTLYILIGLLPWLLPAHSRATALIMTALVFLSMGLNNFGGQAWVNWMADMVPPRIRGRYFARRTRMGVGVIACTTILVALILDSAEHQSVIHLLSPLTRFANMPPLIFLLSIVFIIAGAVGMIDILLFAKVAEPPMDPKPAEPLLARLTRPIKDQQFRRFLAYWSVWTAANSWCTWLWMKYMLDFLQHQKSAAAAIHAPLWWADHLYLVAAITLPVSFMTGQFLGYPIWGAAVDRFGRKPVFFVSSSLHTLTWLWWIFLSPSLLPWLIPIQIAGGLIAGGTDIANFNMMLLFNRKGGAGYQAVGTVIFSLAGALSAVAAGALSTALESFQYTVAEGSRYEHTFNRYPLLILIGATIKYTGDFLFLPRIHDLHSKPASHALRFVFLNMYGTLNTLLFTPVKSTTSHLKKLWP